MANPFLRNSNSSSSPRRIDISVEPLDTITMKSLAHPIFLGLTSFLDIRKNFLAKECLEVGIPRLQVRSSRREEAPSLAMGREPLEGPSLDELGLLWSEILGNSSLPE